MHSFGNTKSLVAVGLIVLIGSLIGLNANDRGTKSGMSDPVSTIKLPNPLLAQIGAPVANQTSSDAEAKAVVKEEPTSVVQKAPIEPIAWKKPEGPEPAWYASVREAEKVVEETRKKLELKVKPFDFHDVPFTALVSEISEELEIDLIIDESELQIAGLDANGPITIYSKQEMSLREFLRLVLSRAGNQAGASLGYTIRERSIEITTMEAIDNDPPLRSYDLSYILPNDSHQETVMMAIQQAVDPTSWLAAGGRNTMMPVGSALLISCPEITHQEIEKVLEKISQIDRSTLEPRAISYGPRGMF